MAPRIKDFQGLVQTLGVGADTEATKGLTKYFARARFGLEGEDFLAHYVDGTNDGGMDFVHEEDGTFYIIQTKFSRTPQRTGFESVNHELRKIGNSLLGENPNTRAQEFVNSLKRSSGDPTSNLEVIWLTTDEVTDEVAAAAQTELQAIRSRGNWGVQVDFVPFDKTAVRRMISDSRYGYVPYTGKKSLTISSQGCIENPGNGTGIKSVVCLARVVDVLKWIHKRDDVSGFLQKNIREYIGETEINRDLKRSFTGAPSWFWYKHNGIIIFADTVALSTDRRSLSMRNPQVVNGGQTITSLYDAYDKGQRRDSDAEVLVRVYRLPYEQAETYTAGIDIIKALNSQNKIQASDLHSTDPQQVRLQEHLETLGYRYHRKRSKEAKSGEFSITMKNLALHYYVVKKRLPHAGVQGQVEDLFAQKSTYEDVLFPEEAIERDLDTVNHIALSYVLTWRISELLDGFRRFLPQRDRGLSEYTYYFVLADAYLKMVSWRTACSQIAGWRNWSDFLHSEQFKGALWQYSKHSYAVATSVLPKALEYRQDPRKFYRTEDATKAFLPKVESSRDFRAIMNRAQDAYLKQET